MARQLPIRYVSTRGTCASVSFKEAVLGGYAPDNGMWMPETIPTVSTDTLQRWVSLTYPQICAEIVSLFVTDEELPRTVLNKIIEDAFSETVFDHKDVVPIVRLEDNGGILYIAELFHGTVYVCVQMILILDIW